MPKRQVFTQREKDLIRQQAISFWEDSTTRQSTFFGIVSEMQRLTKCLLPQELANAYKQYPDRSCLVPPDIYINMASLTSTFRKAIFRRKPYFRLGYPGQPYITDEVTKKAEHLLQACIDQDNGGAGFKIAASQCANQSLYAGVCAGFIEYHTKTMRQAQKDEFGLVKVHPTYGKVMFEDVPVAKYPKLVPYDIRRIRIDPACATFDQRLIVGCQHVEPLSKLLRLNADPNTDYDFKEEDLTGSAFTREKYFEFTGQEGWKYPDKATDLQKAYGDRPVEVHSIRGLFQIQGEDGKTYYHDLKVEMGNRTVLMAVSENDLPIPGWEMFEFGFIDPQMDTMFPMGLVEPARDSFIEEFVKHNQSLDSANRNVYCTYIADASAADGLPEYLESANDNILKIGAVESGLDDVRKAFMVLERPQLGQDTFQHSMVLSRRTQQVMRLSDYVQGQNPSSTETATSVSQIVAGNQVSNENLILNFVDTFLSPVCLKFLTLENYFKGDVTRKITTKDGETMTISPGELDFPFHCSIESAIGDTDPGMARRMVELYPIWAQRPNIDQDLLDQTMMDVVNMPNGDRLLLTSDYIALDIDRENIALASGVPQPVHPKDNHIAHSKGHGEYLDQMSQMPPERMAALKLDPQQIALHKAEHDKYIAEMQASLGNTKAGGGLSSNMVQPDAAAQGNPQKGASGNYTPAEKR